MIRQVRRRLDHSPTEIAIALLSGYFAYLPAEAAGVSAVLAVVTVGIYVGWYTPELTTGRPGCRATRSGRSSRSCSTRSSSASSGCSCAPILDSLHGRSTGSLLADGAIVGGAVIVTRLVWIYPGHVHAALRCPKRIRERDPYPPWQHPTLIGWAGLRGAVSLAAALALPLTIDTGEPFPQRSFIIYIAFCVIMATLVLQGLTLPAVIRLLRLEDDGISDKEETKARIHAAEAALGRLEELAGEDWVRHDTAERMRGAYRFRASRFAARFDDEDDGAIEERSQSYQRLRRELLDAERNAVVELRRQGRINDTVMNRVQRDLDLEDARLDV